MDVGELFAGIGGFGLAAHWTGWRVRWASEIDPYALEVYRKHFPETELVGDVAAWEPDPERHAVDLITGGFPCQPVSVAGKQLAQADERWLWPEFARVVRVLRPRYVVVENVPGLLTRGMGDVLGDLAGLGYDAEWQSIPAAAVGAEHVRDRVWIVAYPDGWGRQVGWVAKPVRVERQSRRFPDRRSAVWQLPDAPHAGWWTTEPDVGRVAHGVPARVDRLRCLGNAIVPQIAAWIFSCIEARERTD